MNEAFCDIDLKVLELSKNWEIKWFRGNEDFAPINYAVRCKNCGISLVTGELSNIPNICKCMRGDIE